MNDARPDPRGSLWAGSMRNNVHPDGSSDEVGGQDGILVRIDPNGRATCFREKIGISNTLAWSPDQRHFYFGDTLANVIWVYDYDASTGAISNERPFLEGFGRGYPDGSAVDSEGYLWNCRFYGNCIVRVAPDGKIDRVVEMPVKDLYLWWPRSADSFRHHRLCGSSAGRSPRRELVCDSNRFKGTAGKSFSLLRALGEFYGL